MADPQQTAKPENRTAPDSSTPNPNAPAGAPDSLGAESIRDGRPSTCDDVVEALDEAGPGPK